MVVPPSSGGRCCARACTDVCEGHVAHPSSRSRQCPTRARAPLRRACGSSRTRRLCRPPPPHRRARSWPGRHQRRRRPPSVRPAPEPIRRTPAWNHDSSRSRHYILASGAGCGPLVCRGGLAVRRARCDRRVRHRRGHGEAQGVPTRPPATADDLRPRRGRRPRRRRPPQAQAGLTYDEVRTLIRAEIEHLEDKILAAPGQEIRLEGERRPTWCWRTTRLWRSCWGGPRRPASTSPTRTSTT